jgi:hypothetical protein
MTIGRFTPLSDVVSLGGAMDRLFEDSIIRPSGGWSTVAAGQVVVPDDIEVNATADTSRSTRQPRARRK